MTEHKPIKDINDLSSFLNPEYDGSSDTNFEEVVHLTEYDLPAMSESQNIIAQYNNINTQQISAKHEIQARNIVGRISKIVMDMGDDQLSENHALYIQEIARLQISDLQDMMMLVEMNREMLNNVIERINATMMEDYNIIEAYNRLANQQVKFIKELSNMYRALPSTFKRIKTEIISDQINPEITAPPVITEDYGTLQFNDSKEMLRKMMEECDSNTDSSKQI